MNDNTETYAACKDKFIWRDLDYVIVMGKTEPAQVFELISEEQNMPPGYDKLLPAYNEALKLYRNQDWVKAIDAFKASDELEDMFPGRKTNPSKIYIPRCEHYRDLLYQNTKMCSFIYSKIDVKLQNGRLRFILMFCSLNMIYILM